MLSDLRDHNGDILACGSITDNRKRLEKCKAFRLYTFALGGEVMFTLKKSPLLGLLKLFELAERYPPRAVVNGTAERLWFPKVEPAKVVLDFFAVMYRFAGRKVTEHPDQGMLEIE